LETAREAPLHYRLCQMIVWLAARILTRIDLSGLERVPRSGAVILSPNHLHFLDLPLLFLLPRRPAVFVAEKWRRHPGGWLMQAFAPIIFVNRGDPDRGALGQALQVLEDGKALGVAPEGTRSRTGALLRGRNGAAFLASRSGAPILPIAAWGQEGVIRSLLHFRRPEVHVCVGELMTITQGCEEARGDQLDALTDQVMMQIARMLPPEYRGVYAARVVDEG
jgi:1-acyl-sn-glycerol-3-phosphate acyltransferase